MSEQLEEIKRIILEHLTPYPNISVFLYGSRAKGYAGKHSDVDVGIYPREEPLPTGVLAELRESLEESAIIWTVELIDLSQADETFRNKVISEGILWRE